MTLTIINREKLALELKLITEDGALSTRGIAELLRRPLTRWGLSPRRTIVRFAREQLEAAGLAERITSSEVGKVLDRLQDMGECQEVFVGHERYVVPCTPRWVPTGEQTATLLSVDSVPHGVVILDSGNQDDVAKRIRVANDDDRVALHIAGVKQCSLEEWIRPFDYLRHGGRRLCRPVRNDTLPLAAYWEVLVESISQEGRLLGEDAEVRILSGQPGLFFGRHDGTNCEGRWTTVAEDGVWCGYRQGYNDAHWHPVLVAIDGPEKRILDLYNRDEWCWALLARGRAMSAIERIDHDGLSLRLSFPPPKQLLTMLDLLGTRSGSWSWAVTKEVSDIWSYLR